MQLKIFPDLLPDLKIPPGINRPCHILSNSLHFYKFHGKFAYGSKVGNPRMPQTKCIEKAVRKNTHKHSKLPKIL